MMNAPRTPRRRVWLAVVAALVPAIPIGVALVLASGQGGAATATTMLFKPVQPAKVPAAAPRSAVPAAPPRPAVPVVPSGPGTLTALIVHPTTMHAAPGGRPIAHVARKTGFGSPEAMWVQKYAAGWLGVVSPLAGNNKLGWIPAASASLARVTWRLDVSLARRRLTVLEDGRPVERYRVAIGRPDAPTPTGRFAVTDRLLTADPEGPYGCCILALSAHAPHAIQGWTGGDRIAIHSTPDTASIGEAASHGCLHVTLAEGRWLINHVPLGTPAYIRT